MTTRSAFALLIGFLVLLPAGTVPAASPSIEIVVPPFQYPSRHGNNTQAMGISNRGAVIGTFDKGRYSQPVGFLRRANGTFSRPLIYPGSLDTFARGVNASGVVCGSFINDGEYIDHGFFFDGRSFTSFDLPGAVNTQVTGINDTGDFVGYSFTDPEVITPFVSIAGQLTSFTIPGVQLAYAAGINNLGQVVGSYTDPVDSSSHGFLRDADGTLTYPIDFPDARNTSLSAINDRGIMVGLDADPMNYYHAIVIQLPRSFLSYDFAPDEITSFTGINNAGMISGSVDEGSFIAQLVSGGGAPAP